MSFVRWMNTQLILILAALFAIPFTSCNSGPSRVGQPSIDASGAGSRAVEAYDKNGDGIVSGSELDSAPTLKAALPRLDTNSDKGVSAEEVSARIDAWKGMRTGLTTFAFTVTLDGSPLSDAVVTFEPEPALGESIKPAIATTNQTGSGRASIPKEQRPDPTSPPGMHIGMYRVKVSKMVGGKELIPAKYNTDTILGQEVAPDVSEIANNRVIYTLSTKP